MAFKNRMHFLGGCSIALAALVTFSVTVKAQEADVSLTVYNDDLALVRDVRKMTLKEGVSEIKFQDVAAQIDPTSVFFQSLTASNDVLILEQNYEYDIVNSDKLFTRYLDQGIDLTTKDGDTFSGTLLNASGGDVILRQSDGSIKVITRASVQTVGFPSLPEGLITRPTLLWQLDVRNGGDHEVEVGYLTSGIQWHAEYVGVTNQDDTELELGGWVSLDNRSGADYRNARLKLVAGSVHRAREVVTPYPRLEKYAVAEAALPDQFEEKAFFEYHLYTLQRRATVANNQIKQISLFPNTGVKVDKTYTYDASRYGKNVRVALEFKNAKNVGLGMPLPKGKVRVYKQDADKALVFIGEDFIAHTPKDEKVKVYVGDAFDIVAERIQKDRKSIGRDSWEETWEIKLRNHKDEGVTVKLIEHFGNDWEILNSTHTYTKKDANTVEFDITLSSEAEITIDFTVRYNR